MKLKPFLLILAVLFAACKGYDSPIDGKKIDDMTFGPEQGFQEISLKNDDVENLSCTSSENWCIPSVREGKLLVAVTDNKTYSERTATVDVKDSKDGSHVSFKVTQQQNNAIQVDKKIIEVPEEGGMATINFKSNLKWEVLPQVEWIHAGTRGSRALESYRADVLVEPNESGDPREGKVIIRDAESSWYNEVTIIQGFTYSLKIDPDAVIINEKSSEIEVTVQTNTSFIVEFSNQNPTKWLEEGTRIKIGDKKYSQIIKVSPLPTEKDYRYGEVFFAHFRDGQPVIFRAMMVEQKRDK